MVEGLAANNESIASGEVGLLRYAGHASCAGLDGWESHLGLEENSLLTVGAILTLPATPAYVVLSGCETAATSAARGASGLGLAQAFVIAGAGWVVASTRPVKDLDASAIVTALYAEQALRSDTEIAVHLQAAQKKLIEAAPAIDWASFRVIVPRSWPSHRRSSLGLCIPRWSHVTLELVTSSVSSSTDRSGVPPSRPAGSALQPVHRACGRNAGGIRGKGGGVMDRERERVCKALAGDVAAVHWLVALLSPVIQARVARALLRRACGGRSTRQEVEDVTQEVFVGLFENDGKVLRSWEPGRGMSLANFIGLVAEREAVAILRSGRRSPWTEDPTLSEDLERLSDNAVGPEARMASQQLLTALLERVRAMLSPKGLDLFERLYVCEESVETVCSATGMSHHAVYAWRSRLGKLVRTFAAEQMSDSLEPPRVPKQDVRP